jgi:hypothetical protein
VRVEEGPSQAPAEGEANDVSSDGADPDESDHGRQRHLTALRHHAAHYDCRLARDEQADERGRLEERKPRHSQVGPLTE